MNGKLRGNTLFVVNNRDQDRIDRKVTIATRAIMSCVIIAVLTLTMIFVFGYLIPFLQAEISGTSTVPTESNLSSIHIDEIINYDENDLPIYENNINLRVATQKYPQSEDFTPETSKIGNVLVDKNIEEAVRKLCEEAKKEGYELAFTEGYISYKEQNRLYEETVESLISEKGMSNVMARTEAKAIIAVAGESDFQTGLCMRIDGDIETFESSKTYLWLNRNMDKFGFVFRYPSDKEEVMGVKADSRVIRYVGVENAGKMRQLAMCLEEYISHLKNNGLL
jgi:D-alanyl-D-alanine carboxypeptidase